METTAEKNQITGILSLPQFLYVLSWVIERKHQRPHPQLVFGYRPFSYCQNTTLGTCCYDLVQTAVFLTKIKKRVKFHPLLTFSERVHIVHFFPACFAGCGTWKVVCNVLSFLLSTGVEQAFMIFLGSGLFFYSFICLHYEIVTVLVRVDKKVLHSVVCQFSDMTCIGQVIFFIFYFMSLSSSF